MDAGIKCKPVRARGRRLHFLNNNQVEWGYSFIHVLVRRITGITYTNTIILVKTGSYSVTKPPMGSKFFEGGLICTHSFMEKLGKIGAFGGPPLAAARAWHTLEPSVPGRVLGATGDWKKWVRFSLGTCDHLLACCGCRFHGFKLIQFILHQ